MELMYSTPMSSGPVDLSLLFLKANASSLIEKALHYIFVPVQRLSSRLHFLGLFSIWTLESPINGYLNKTQFKIGHRTQKKKLVTICATPSLSESSPSC